MHPVKKVLFQLFCISFCASPTSRRLILLLHCLATLTTLTYVYHNQSSVFIVPLSIDDKDSLTVRVWFFSVLTVYWLICLESFTKDEWFMRKYKKHLQGIYEKHQDQNKRDIWSLVIYFLAVTEVVYLVLVYWINIQYLPIYLCSELQRITQKIRILSYLQLSRPVLLELEELVEKVKEIPENASQQAFLNVQNAYSDLWKVSEIIGNNYVVSLCSSTFLVFLELIVSLFWYFTLDFADDRFWCRE